MLAAIATILATIAGFPLLIMAAEVLAGLRRPRPFAANGPMPRTTVLIPAHDEAGGIEAVICAMSESGCDILVVADNCTDDTAKNAREAGVRVTERVDTSLRGKGFALAFGRDALRADPPDVIIVMDADCIPHGDALVRLACQANQTGRVVQARYQLDTRVDDVPTTRISNFAFSLKNVLRQRGLMQLSGTCLLTGTGMAFPWPLFDAAPLATADSVEDLAIGLALVRAGKRPLYADDALVTSAPASGVAAITQRTRWEHGFILTALTVAPQMMMRGIRTLDWASFWLGMHLIVPPLALAFGIAGLALVMTLMLGAFSSFAPALGLAVITAVAGIAVMCGWRVVGRAALPFSTLLRVPLYVAWKLPIYLKLARGADRRWTRTERD
jgi:cellulose synthase/poly-beta-1,6-N-acetylglucosamine synthase-like glycosyltransferase